MFKQYYYDYYDEISDVFDEKKRQGFWPCLGAHVFNMV
jgi:hypothetical protein